ncbi:MAG: cell division protein FtsQ [Chitinophagales bacterium]|nr:MAG: cell division protein FtsQ [Chitinophagales bacterium]
MEKKPQPNLKYQKLIRAAYWISASIIFFVILGAAVLDNSTRPCTAVRISINHESGLFFLDENDVAEMISAFYQTSLTETPVRHIPLKELEQKLEANPYVENAEVYTDNKGALHVFVEQAKPLVRIVNTKGVSYYLDVKGKKIPLSPKFTARVVVATGNLQEDDKEQMKRLLDLCRFISEDKFWQSQFEQINITGSGDYDLVPKLGNYLIRLGKPEMLEEKFWKMEIFYKEVLKNVDSKDFRIVNLEFKDQIVCTKKNNGNV